MDLTHLAAEVVAEVERLLREGRSGRVEVNVHPGTRRLWEVKTMRRDMHGVDSPQPRQHPAA